MLSLALLSAGLKLSTVDCASISGGESCEPYPDAAQQTHMIETTFAANLGSASKILSFTLDPSIGVAQE